VEKVRDIMTRGVKTVDRYETILEAAKIMRSLEFGTLLVTEKSYAIGILTEGDIVSRAVSEGYEVKRAVEDIMSSPLKTISADSSIEEALQKMRELKVKKLPVLKSEKVVGIVTLTDIIENMPQLWDKVNRCKKEIRRSKTLA